MTDSSKGAAERERLCRALDVVFSTPVLLQQALRHKSAGATNNERLEFLGDALLGMVVAEALYARHPAESEAGLSLMRATLVRRESLAVIARELELSRVIEVGPGELRSGGHNRDSILADAVEAIIGAVYLDAGFAAAQELVLRLMGERLATVRVTKDAKTRLQELLQANRSELPRYSVQNVTGADHERRFEVCCELVDGSESAMGEASSRRAAEQAAAASLLQVLEQKLPQVKT